MNSMATGYCRLRQSPQPPAGDGSFNQLEDDGGGSMPKFRMLMVSRENFSSGSSPKFLVCAKGPNRYLNEYTSKAFGVNRLSAGSRLSPPVRIVPSSRGRWGCVNATRHHLGKDMA